jgi:CRP/FNR family cyclic AMP-dependent transcriptional regulator
MNPHLKSALYDIPLLAGIEDSGYELLAEGIRESNLPAGHVIIREGDAGNYLFMLRKGRVRIFRTSGRGEVELMTLSAPSFFGEMSILEAMPRSASVQAATPVDLLILPRAYFEMLADKFPIQYSRVATNVARDLSARLRLLGDEYARRH